MADDGSVVDDGHGVLYGSRDRKEVMCSDGQ
jgi:hypothetical protein